MPYTNETIDDTFSKFDADKNSMLDFEEFILFIQSLKPTDNVKELR